MTFIPFSTIKTQNLTLLLLTARAIAYLAAVLFGLGCLLILVNLIISVMPPAEVEVAGTKTLMQSNGFGMALGGAVVVAASLVTFAISGACAALVSWEYNRAK